MHIGRSTSIQSPDCAPEIYERLAAYLGLELHERDRQRIARAVQHRMGQLRLTDSHQYLKRVDDELELDTLVGSATVGESWFFRDAGQMRLIRHLLMEQMISAERLNRRLRLWSAGCATGQEPWSLAMLALDAIPDADQWDLLVLGTDINADALAFAEAGVYSGWGLRGLGDASKERFFTREGEGWRVGPRLRRYVRFQRDNLIGPGSAPIEDADLVLCRNVLIYLKRDCFSRIIGRFRNAMHPNGLLMVGHCELLDQSVDGFEVLRLPDSLIYRRAAEPSADAASPVRVLPAKARIARIGSRSGDDPIAPRDRRAGGPPMRAGLDTRNWPPAGTTRGRPASAADAPSAASKPRRAAAHAAPKPPGMRLEDDGSADQLLAQAEAEAAGGRYQAAIGLARAAHARDALDYRPLYLSAQLAELLDDGNALPWLQKVLYLAPDFVPAYLDAAAHFDRLGYSERAMGHRRAARRLLDANAGDDVLPPPYQHVPVGTLRDYLDELLAEAEGTDDLIGKDAEQSLSPTCAPAD